MRVVCLLLWRVGKRLLGLEEWPPVAAAAAATGLYVKKQARILSTAEMDALEVPPAAPSQPPPRRIKRKAYLPSTAEPDARAVKRTGGAGV